MPPLETSENGLKAIAALTGQGQVDPVQLELLRRRAITGDADARAARAMAMPPNVDPRAAAGGDPGGLGTRMARLAAIQGPLQTPVAQPMKAFDAGLLAAIENSRERNFGLPVAFVDRQGRPAQARGDFQFGQDQARDRRLAATGAQGATPEEKMANNLRAYTSLRRDQHNERALKVDNRAQDQGAVRQAALGNPFAIARRAGDPDTVNALLASMVSHASGGETLAHIAAIKAAAQKARETLAANALAREIATMTSDADKKKEENRHTEADAKLNNDKQISDDRLEFETKQHDDRLAHDNKVHNDEHALNQLRAQTDSTKALTEAARQAQLDKLARMMASPDYMDLQNPNLNLTPEQRAQLRAKLQLEYGDALNGGVVPTPEQLRQRREIEENTGGADVGEQHLIQGKITAAGRKKLKEHLDNFDPTGIGPWNNYFSPEGEAQKFADAMISRYPNLALKEAALKDAYRNWNNGIL